MTTRTWTAAVALAVASGAAMAQTPAPGPAPTPAPAVALPSNAGYLAANCANCHGTTGQAKGAMPSLAGVPRATIVEQFKAFRDGKRAATIMHQLAKGYTDAQIELIADFYSKQTPAR